MRKISENESKAISGGKKYWVKCMKHGDLYSGKSYVKALSVWWKHALSTSCEGRYLSCNF